MIRSIGGKNMKPIINKGERSNDESGDGVAVDDQNMLAHALV